MSMADEAKSLIGGNLPGLAQKFKDSGLDEQVSSWISKGENMPIVGDQIKKVLGDETVAGIATKLGIAPDDAADQLAEELPRVVDEQTQTERWKKHPALARKVSGREPTSPCDLSQRPPCRRHDRRGTRATRRAREHR
jgi:hypothetical protein